MSFSNSSGGTLTIPSPTHVHHVDVSSAVRSLRRSMSRSPSKWNLGRTNSQSSESSQSSHSATEQSPCRRYTTTNPQFQVASPVPSSLTSTTPQHPPPSASSFSTPFRPSVKLSLRSAKSSKASPTLTRPTSRPRVSPKSPLKRALSIASDLGNSAPSSSSSSDATGQENGHLPIPLSPLPRRNIEKSYRHSLHLDVSGTSHQAIFRALEGHGDLQATPGTGALKRSDAIMNLDQASLGSPVAKRRSLHGISSLGPNVPDFSIFDSGPTTTTPSFEIHDDGNREYELFGSSTSAQRELLPSPTPAPTMPRRSSSLRKSTLQQRQVDRGSWGRRMGAQNLAQMGGEFTTPNVKARPRLSLDQFIAPELARDSPFSSNSPLPNPSAHPMQRPPHLPHPLSRTLTNSSSGNSLQEERSTQAPSFVVDRPRMPINFAKSLPYGGTRPHLRQESGHSNAVSTPFKPVRPWQGAFMSTGLVSKVNRNPEEEPDQKLAMPDTPCKKQPNGFATFPPPPTSAMKKSKRNSYGGMSATPFNLPKSQAPGTFGNPGKGIGIFSRLSGRHARRGSVLSLEGEDKRFGFDNAGATPGNDGDYPPTPTKQTLVPSLSNLSEQSIESPTAHRKLSPPMSAVRPVISRESTASPVEQSSPRTPQASLNFPDASGLSISNANGDHGRMPPPVTPTTGRESFHAPGIHLMTPANGRGNVELDDSLYSRFDKIELVGKGEFSTVYRVVKSAPRSSFLTVFGGNRSQHSPSSPIPDKVYAVKKSRRQFTGPRDRELKLREVRALQALTHGDHVLHYVDSWEQNYYLYIQTEFCDEGTLDKFLSNIGRTGRLDDFRIWKIIHDISLGLQTIHDAGFIHLDLKPANIFITFEGILKIGDFGLATKWPAGKGVDAEGDREYIGPEILRGEFDKPADIYSFGLIIIEMACNVVLPDNGPTWIALRSGDLSEVPSLTRTNTSDTPRDAAGVPTTLSNESIMEHTSAPDISVYSDPELGHGLTSHGTRDSLASPKRSELKSPPAFMSDALHHNSLDQLVKWMLQPEPRGRPTVHQLLMLHPLVWVADRRHHAATVFEGMWGPGDDEEAERGLPDEDTEMMDV